MLDVAVDAMAAERVEHERVQVQVQVRARMPLLPPALQGFGRHSDYRVLHGVDVLFGHRALRGFGGRRHHGAPVVAGVDGSDAYRAEAEPFTAKRSGTG